MPTPKKLIAACAGKKNVHMWGFELCPQGLKHNHLTSEAINTYLIRANMEEYPLNNDSLVSTMMF
jgi:hypothetical protein